jgi:nucleotide-binding universal stress UspA family protein
VSVDLIVVGLDDSPGSCAAVRWTADLAAQLGARVVAVHAYEPLGHLDEIEPGTDFAEVREHVRQKAISEWCDPFIADHVSHEIRVEEGRPADVILDVAREVDADLIVLGARRLGLVRTLTLGSTSHKVIHEARRPVTVLHPPEE